jgi:type I restriction enzyme M protein
MMNEELPVTERGQSLTLTDIAKLVKVGVSAVSNWRRRHANFPQPTVVSGQELFAAGEVAAWLSQRKIAQNSLRSDEAPGTTYGDRFIRNGGLPAPSVHAIPSPAAAEVRPDRVTQMRQVMSTLRSDLEIVSAVDFIMALLYLYATNRELWRIVSEQSSWRAAQVLLRDVSLPGQDVPLFEVFTSDLSGGQRLLEAIRLFDEIDLDSVGSVAMFDTLLENVNRDLGRHGGHFTPSSVVKCMVEVLAPESTNTVYDPSCGSGELLAATAERGVESVFGQAMNGRSFRMALLNLSMHNSGAELRIGGPEIRHGAFPGDQFDMILTNPPFNISLPENAEPDTWPFEAPTKHSANFAWLQIAVHKLKPGGRACVLMPNGPLFAGGRSSEIRRKMIEAGVVEGIIALPARLFADTMIPVSLWLLRRPKPDESAPAEVLFVDAVSLGTAGERAQRVLREDDIGKIVQVYRHWRDSGRSGDFGDSPGFARSAGIEEIRQNEYVLEPRLYIREGTDSRASHKGTPSSSLDLLRREMDEIAEEAKQVRRDVDVQLDALLRASASEFLNVSLGDVCAIIQAGPGMVDRERGVTMQGWTPLVLPRNIRRGHISHEELDTVSPEISAKFASYRLRSGDIVTIRSGTLGRHALVQEAEDGWLLGPSCMRLRLGSDSVVPEYLVHYLNSAEAHKWIMAKSRGTAILHINAAVLRELVIPLPSVEVQRAITSAMDLINVHIEQHRRAAMTMQSLREHVFPALTQN